MSMTSRRCWLPCPQVPLSCRSSTSPVSPPPCQAIDISPGERERERERENTFRHLPTLAVHYAHAFFPTIFTAQGKQPLTVLAPWSDIAVPEGNLFSTAVLSCRTLMEGAVGFTPYLSNWRQRFDFVLVVNADIADQYVGDIVPPA